MWLKDDELTEKTDMGTQPHVVLSDDGRGGGIRTHDPLLPKQFKNLATIGLIARFF